MTSAIHHVTAVAGNARRNLDFHTRVLGLRLVKKTVNFDDPGTYHFYYGDERGSPGTILTFFSWEHAAPGRNGIGLAMETAFAFPRGRSAIGCTASWRRASPIRPWRSGSARRCCALRTPTA